MCVSVFLCLFSVCICFLFTCTLCTIFIINKVNVQNVDGKTPLHVAVERQQCEVIMFLLNAGADVGLADVWRNTPLHYLTTELLQCGELEECVVKQTKTSQHLLIRNAVGVTALSYMAAHGIIDYVNRKQEISNASIVASETGLDGEQLPCNFSSVKISRLTELQQRKAFLKKTVYCRKELQHTDCYGNTILHHVVGVYAPLKMYRVSKDVIKIVDSLVKRGADINTPNNDGLTPLHVARGKEAIEACLQHADNHSFTITDKRGRNFCHRLFLLPNQNKIERATMTWPIIADSHDKYNGDDLNRNALHYACMHKYDLNEWQRLAEEFVLEFSGEHINKQDKFGRTALHYAAMCGNSKLMNLLKTNKAADETVHDNFGKTAGEYENIYYGHKFKIPQMRSHVSSFHSISFCIQQCFSDVSHNSRVSVTELRKSICDSKADSATSYVLNTYLKCCFDYKFDINWDRLELLVDNDGSAIVTQPPKMFTLIQSRVEKAMQHLATQISANDTRFACEIVPVGSAREETKIGCCDEFDYTFLLTDLSGRCEVCYSPESPPGFVLLKSSMLQYNDEDLFHRNGILITRIVKFKFENLVKQILSTLSFCEATGFEFIDPVQDDILRPGTTSTKLHTYIKLRFINPVTGCHVPHNISVDVVPALRIDGWWPDDMRRDDLCQTGDCLIVFTQPHLKYPWISWTQPHGFVSFARAESRLLRDCPRVIRAAYIVVKRMSKNFSDDEFFSSYVIKTATFWCMDDMGFSSECSSSSCNEDINEDEVLHWVRSILQCLLRFAAQDYVPCYFMPKCHQPVWLGEKHLKQFHMRLYRHGLQTYTDLFSLNEHQSRDSLLKYIKSLFIRSHVMYWTVLSDDDELKLFVPSTVNPLTENDVCTTLLPTS